MSSLVNAGPVPLNSANLDKINGELVILPSYDRSSVKTGIVHVGIGGFHRSHEAYYTHQLMEQGLGLDWGICGIALLKWDKRIYDTLVAQDGLYTLMINDLDGTPSATVIGSIVEYMYAPDNSEAVLEKMASIDTKIISLTITEGGYNMNPVTGMFQLENEAIQHDIRNPSSPETVFGYIAQAMKRRMQRGIPGLTIQSCDNIQHNGDCAKRMFCAYISVAEPNLLTWFESNVAFPNAMVDRITPVTTPTDIKTVQTVFGLADAWPVVCEPFIQWVIEDTFSPGGRPCWDKVGAQFVPDVSPYEKMKIRMLNGSHTALAFTGILHGFEYVFETMSDPLFAGFLNDFMELEVTSILDAAAVPGVDLGQYRRSLLERFANPNIKDQLTRICSETSAKAPKFLIATINDHLSSGADVSAVRRCIVVLAAWCRYLELSVGSAHSPGYSVQDEMKDVLVATAVLSKTEGQAAAFLGITQLFGNLAANAMFVQHYVEVITSLRANDIVHVLKSLV
jgi:mannitol 2-dehydrogenase